MPQANSQSPPSIGSPPGVDGQSKATEVAEAAQEKAQQAAGQAQEKAQQAAGQVQDRVREQIDQRSSQAAEQIKEQGSDLRSVGESLRKEGKDGAAKAADRLAEYAEKVGDYLSDKDSHALLSDAEDFGRKQPWAVAAGGLALGFVASRFLKASSSQRYESHPSRRQGAPVPIGGGTGTSGGAAPFTGSGAVMPGAAPGVL